MNSFISALAWGGAFGLLLCLSSPTFATVWTVRADGSGDTPTIQEAISKSQDGDIVRLAPGTYHEDVRFWGKGITLESESGPTVTILDGSEQDSAIVNLVDHELPGTTIRALTFRNGKGTDLGFFHGGAIYCGGPSTVLIEDSVFSDNGPARGGAIAAWPGEVTLDASLQPRITIRNNTFIHNNSSLNGGAIFLWAGTETEISNNVFRYNRTKFDGGAIYASGNFGQVVIRSNEFWENKAWDKGGALMIANFQNAGHSTIEDNLFVRNIARGQDVVEDGAGGAMAVYLQRGGVIQRNTLVFNDGRGNTKESGGGITLRFGTRDLTISHNIFAYNLGTGISCFHLADPNAITMGPNIFWKNSNGPFGDVLDLCPLWWEGNIINMNPLFCYPQGDVFSCYEGAPAISGPEVFGAFPEPGCGMIMPVEETTWGKIKAFFHEGP